jgi:Flp pilus assembly pilin Flp
MISCIKSLFRRVYPPKAFSQKGQTLVEYALILAIISVVAIGVFAQLGREITVIFSSIDSMLDTAQVSH